MSNEYRTDIPRRRVHNGSISFGNCNRQMWGWATEGPTFFKGTKFSMCLVAARPQCAFMLTARCRGSQCTFQVDRGACGVEGLGVGGQHTVPSSATLIEMLTTMRHRMQHRRTETSLAKSNLANERSRDWIPTTPPDGRVTVAKPRPRLQESALPLIQLCPCRSLGGSRCRQYGALSVERTRGGCSRPGPGGGPTTPGSGG